AGEFRKTNKNIGIDKWQIPSALKTLLDDTVYWHTHKTYSPDELTLRFKHRLVSIHCFSNGNGRHSRLMADIIIQRVFKLSLYTWGTTSNKADPRHIYLNAMKEADRGNIQPLIDFARG
ncbi:MAG TPA: mobile mystery protein B, partial [Cyclobacteriaceae bacterium]|nr:mobile mystery protein B [Cyclobacteriaceae bacterium]